MKTRRWRGFTLIELMIALALLGLLLALAAPSMAIWIRNTQVRTMAETLANGIRLAQTESVRRNRTVVFFLTNAQPSLTATATADGVNWVMRWVPLAGDTVTATAPAFEPFIQGGSIADFTAGVSVTGPAAICFNPMGRRIAATAVQTGVVGAVCAVDPDAPLASFDVQRTGADRPRRVNVALGGQVRLCDPARTLAAATPDGCP